MAVTSTEPMQGKETSLECQRNLFSLPVGSHYLNCAYMAPTAKPIEQVAAAALQRLRMPADIGPADFFDPSDRVRRRFAELIGCRQEQVALLPSVSYGMAIVAQNLVLPSDSEILVSGSQFPSNYYPWTALARRQGLVVRTIEPPPTGPGRGARWNELLLDAISDRTSLIALPQVHWADGTRFALPEIARRARDCDAALVLDTTQSVGSLDLDLDAVRPDALIAAGYKTLLGPYGTAFGYFGERFREGRPLEETWIARQGSDDFARLVDYCEVYRPTAERFDVGQRSQPVLVPMLDRALELVTSWGAKRIQRYGAGLWSAVAADLDALGCWLEEPQQRCEHLVGLHPPAGTDLESLRTELARRQVYVSIRGSSVRVAVQPFNDESDLGALVEALRAVL